MRPLVRWPGGLEDKLELLVQHIPESFENYYDPFLGSGALYFEVEARQYYVNDSCNELMDIYRAAKKGRKGLWHTLDSACSAWKKIEAHILCVQDELIQMAFEWKIGWFKSYTDFALAVKEVMGRIWYSTLFTFTIPDPADFAIEMRHKVIEALLVVADNGMDKDEAVASLLTAMKEAIFNFMVEVYNRPAVDGTVKSGALMFISHYSRQLCLYYDDTEEMRPDYIGADADKVYVSDLMEQKDSEAFVAKMERTHFWNMPARAFLQKNKISYDDFLFLNPQSDDDLSASLAYLHSPRCDTHWMLLTEDEETIDELTSQRGVRGVEVPGEQKLTMIKNY